jgi:hypothetical protein
MISYLVFVVGTICGFAASAFLLGAERGEMETELAWWRERSRLLLSRLESSSGNDATIDFPEPGRIS